MRLLRRQSRYLCAAMAGALLALGPWLASAIGNKARSSHELLGGWSPAHVAPSLFVLGGLGLLYFAIATERCGVRSDGRPSRWRLFSIALVAMGVQFAFSLAWTSQFSLPGRVLLSLLQATLAAAPLLVLRPHRCIRGAVTFAAAITLGEALRRSVPLGGFPMGGFTSSLVDSPIIGIATVLGPLGLCFAAAALGAIAALGVHLVLSRLLFRSAPTSGPVTSEAATSEAATGKPGTSKPVTRLVLALVLIGIIGSVAATGARTSTTPTGSAISVAVIQGGGEQGLAREDQSPREVFDRHIALAADHAWNNQSTQARLIVFPENVAISSNSPTESPQGKALAQLARQQQAWVIAGFVELTGDSRFINSALLYNPAGELVDTYAKRKLVPFGEFVPARSLVDKFADLSQVPNDAFAGTETPTLRGHWQPNGTQEPAAPQRGELAAGVAISYEVMFPILAAEASRAGGQFLAVPTNASSYLSGSVSAEQVREARLRAIENRRWVVMAAPTGQSAVIAPSGAITDISRRSEARVLERSIQPRSGTTPYALAKDLPMILACLLIALGKRSWACNLSTTCRTQLLPSKSVRSTPKR